mgnify:CR=1 FL=1
MIKRRGKIVRGLIVIGTALPSVTALVRELAPILTALVGGTAVFGYLATRTFTRRVLN